MTLAERLKLGEVMGLHTGITHARRGRLRHAFRTQADFVLLAPEYACPPRLMGRNRFNLISFHDTDHGGPRGCGTGSLWAWAQFEAVGFCPGPGCVLALLAQPRFLGHWFNPVSFWMVIEGDALRAVIAEVNNTFGQRHSYLLVAPDHAPITERTQLQVRKVFHVSPFQDVAGVYQFRFALSPHHVAIYITHACGDEGVDTAMSGPLDRLSSRDILVHALGRPGGTLRVIAIIYWHALRLKLKGAAYRKSPPPPDVEISS